MSEKYVADTNRRVRPRVPVRFRAEFSNRRIEGTGTVRNISTTGALIEPASPLPMAGVRITLQFSFLEESVPISVPARVVRETERGFAVEFLGLAERTRSLLGVAIAKLLTRRADSAFYSDYPLDADEDDADVTLMKIDSQAR